MILGMNIWWQLVGRSITQRRFQPSPSNKALHFSLLVDLGDIWDLNPSSNQSGPSPVPLTDCLTATGDCINHFFRQLPGTVYRPVSLDNLYTTLSLLGRLHHDLHMAACVTAHLSSAQCPPVLKIPNQDIGNNEYDVLAVLAAKNRLIGQQIGSHFGFDNAPVTNPSTLHDCEAQQERRRKQPAKKSTNVKIAQEAFPNLQKKDTMIPLCIDDNYHTLGAEDIADQLCSYLDTLLTSCQTWWHMLFWAYISIVTNAYFIYTDMPQSSNIITPKQFHL